VIRPNATPSAPGGWELLAHMRRVMCTRPEVAYAVGCLPLLDQLELTLELLKRGRNRSRNSRRTSFCSDPAVLTNRAAFRALRSASNRSGARNRPHSVGRRSALRIRRRGIRIGRTCRRLRAGRARTVEREQAGQVRRRVECDWRWSPYVQLPLGIVEHAFQLREELG
jgi:hypothetical protein